MISVDDVLERLAPTQGWTSDWPDVLDRASERRSGGFVSKHRIAVAVAVLGAVLVPLAAVGATNDWWFLSVGRAPTPTHAPVIVKEGKWDGHAWQLVAYPSTTDGLCVSMIPKGSGADGSGAAMGCGTFAGVPRTPATKGSSDMTITYLMGSGSKALPAYVVGPVIRNASVVEIRFSNGQTLRAATFPGPEPLQHVRFYAARLPNGLAITPRAGSQVVKSVAGLDTTGEIVACLVPQTAKDGTSHLADCR